MEKFLNQRGQSAVEYILLLAVITALAIGVFKSRAFQNFLGKDSSYFEVMAREIEVHYRYGLTLENPSENPHSGFYQAVNDSRFFSGRDAYPPQQ